MGFLHGVGSIAQQPPGQVARAVCAPLCALPMGRGLQSVAHGKGQQLSAGMEGCSLNEKATPCAASSSWETGARLRANTPNGVRSDLGPIGCTALMAETPNKSICPVFC